MSGENRPVNVRILEKEYRVACPDDEREGLMASAEYLNRKMKEIRDTGKVVGVDRIAVMAALNITHELLQQTSVRQEYQRSMSSRIRALQEKIELALNKGRQLEL
ncbi:MAG TPA: cell division protein ZapA [Gammaproteobacteria bacterium]|nr:cell division protein ZapA [Gammaproteobacteria bacterium]